MMLSQYDRDVTSQTARYNDDREDIHSCTIVQFPDNLPEPVALDFNHALVKRHPYKYAGRPCFFYSYQTGDVIMPDGKRGTIPASTDLMSLLEKIQQYSAREKSAKKEVNLYLVSGNLRRNRPKQEWFQASHGWKRSMWIWDKLMAQYERNGFSVYLYCTGNYFGEEKNISRIYDAWNELEQELEDRFNAKGYRMVGSTPAMTGRELLSISLPKDREYAKLPNELLDLLWHNFGQGRVQTFSPKREVLEDGCFILDGRFMYAACLSHLPVGNCYHDTTNEFLGVTRKDGKLAPSMPGFYRVTVQVPLNWHHIGLIKSNEVTEDHNAIYPNEPGQVFSNWTTASELALALYHGWSVEIHERLYWPGTEELTDVLANWRKKLVDFRKETTNPLLQQAIRAIVLHTVGSFHQFIEWKERFTPLAELPFHPRLYPLLKKKSYRRQHEKFEHGSLVGIEWDEAVLIAGDRQQFIRPEWSATVWGRARAKLAEFALRLPYEDIVCLMTDCVYSASLPLWLEREDTGKPGSFREKRKERISGPWTWPANSSQMRQFIIQHHLSRNDTSILHKLGNSEYSELEDTLS